MLYLNGEKIAWVGGDGPQAGLVTDVMLEPGPNRLTVYATDDQGLESSSTAYVRGEVPVAVDAEGSEDP